MSRRREQLVPDQPSKIVFEDYVSRHGRTIRVDVQHAARLDELESMMRDLAAGRSQTVRLSQLTDTHWVLPLEDIVMTVGGRIPDTKYEHRGEKLICLWSDSIEGWLESAEKIAYMTVHGKPCHQDLKGWHADSVKIEISYLE